MQCATNKSYIFHCHYHQQNLPSYRRPRMTLISRQIIRVDFTLCPPRLFYKYLFCGRVSDVRSALLGRAMKMQGGYLGDGLSPNVQDWDVCSSIKLACCQMKSCRKPIRPFLHSVWVGPDRSPDAVYCPLLKDSKCATCLIYFRNYWCCRGALHAQWMHSHNKTLICSFSQLAFLVVNINQ